MSTTSSLSNTLTHPFVTAPSDLCQRVVFQALQRMTEGSLRLELPDGTVHHLGSYENQGTASIRVLHPAFFQRCLLFGDIGLGESYVAGEWETDSIKSVIAWAIRNVKNSPVQTGSMRKNPIFNLFRFYNDAKRWLRPNNLKIAQRNIEEHYDLGNDFYQLWLDPTMSYSSGIYRTGTESLREAQIDKYEALCRKLRLTKQDRVLEIGCGWGGFASYAAQKYGCTIKAVTISPAQEEFAKKRFAEEGLDHLIEVERCDYRQLSGTFDKIVSIEMMEALGDRYLPTFCAKLETLLAPDGIVAVQYITVPDSRHAGLRRSTDWIQKHIFPGSLLLSVGRVSAAMLRTGTLSLVELDDLGLSYARTLNEWWKTFNQRRTDVLALGFSPSFIRKWNYYLQYCEAAFASRNISVVHAVYARPNNPHLV